MFKKLLAVFQRSKPHEDAISREHASAGPRSTGAPTGGSTVQVPATPEFWYSWFGTFGAIGDPVDEDTLAEAFGVTSDGALAWWSRFTGWYEGVIDEADGHVDHPAVVRAELVGGAALEAAIHPGNIYFSLNAEGTRVVVGNIGPHWSLPVLSLDEAAALSRRLLHEDIAAKARTFLFLSVGVWLGESERARAREIFIRYCLESGLVEPAATPPLASAWINAVRQKNIPSIKTPCSVCSASLHGAFAIPSWMRPRRTVASIIRKTGA